MSTLEFLENLASEASTSYGMSIGDARRLVRLAMVTIAGQVGVPSERIAAYIESVGTAAQTAMAPGKAS
jgi:hypothetical protein